MYSDFLCIHILIPETFGKKHLKNYFVPGGRTKHFTNCLTLQFKQRKELYS